MAFDIKTLKLLGYNMLRKHVKVEPALYYAAADELGILIMQDMPCLVTTRLPNLSQHKEFQRQSEVLVKQLKSYSSIFAWVSSEPIVWNADCFANCSAAYALDFRKIAYVFQPRSSTTKAGASSLTASTQNLA